ncbi:MAG: TerB family tellurite resistance protein [Pseudomonadales bacterium]|jgi:uncharacterized tellurite resistance protein B-like protein|nr:TerB family tellurite resistance protein [Pseudomonadales bacterium]
MLKQIRAFFERSLQHSAEPAANAQRLRLACAALLVELSMADTVMEEAEIVTLRAILRQQFHLDDAALEELWQLAQSAARDATSLYQFTTLINESYGYAAKIELLEHLWQVAYADGRIDPQEEHLIRKLTDLLYLSHGDFIRAKLKVRPAAQ